MVIHFSCMAKKKIKKRKATKKKKRLARGRAMAERPVRKARVSRTRKRAAAKKARAVKRSAKAAKARNKKAASASASTKKGAGDKRQNKVEALILMGKERGYITYDEILREFPTIEDNVSLLEEIYDRFSVAGIDVLEGGACSKTLPLIPCWRAKNCK